MRMQDEQNDDPNHSTEEQTASEIDDVIMDDEDNNFTTDVSNMAGAPYAHRVKEYIRNSAVQIPAQPQFITNASSTKTAYKSNQIFKDFEFKKENLLEIL